MELGILIAALILASIALCISCVSLIKVIATEKATHTVQFMPVDETINKENEEYMKQWATSEKSVNEQNKLYKEDVEEAMPEFALDDEDKEIFSI